MKKIYLLMGMLAILIGAIAFVAVNLEEDSTILGGEKQNNFQTLSKKDAGWIYDGGDNSPPDYGGGDGWIIDGNTVYMNDSKAYISATPHTVPVNDWVEFEVMTKQFSGDIDVALGFDTSKVRPLEAEYYSNNPFTIEESYQCLYDFNYTADYFWCYENETDIIFEHHYDRGNIQTQTAYWDVEYSEGWRDFASSWESINYNYEDTNKWWYMKDVPMVALQERRFRVKMQNLQERDGTDKYYLALKPSHQTFGEAISAGNFYVLDPWVNATDGNWKTIDLSDPENYINETFTTNGTWTKPSWVSEVAVIVVAGGGGNNNNDRAGGGGAGGVIFNESYPVTGNVAVTVGVGGIGAPKAPTAGYMVGGRGQNSTFGTLEANGGGGGVSVAGDACSAADKARRDGGSGGGGGRCYDGTNDVSGGTAWPDGQGNDGGAGWQDVPGAFYRAGGGGGGYGSVGGDSQLGNIGGDGGAGLYFNGMKLAWGGYGIGSGGGAGTAADAPNNSGAGANATQNGGIYDGGSGIVIVFYEKEPSGLNIVLNSPDDAYILTDPYGIDFNVTVTDNLNVENVSLYIDGELNETNSSGFNGTYIFNKYLGEGNHTWKIIAYDNESKVEQSDERDLDVNYSYPNPVATAPVNHFNGTTPTIYYNATVLDYNTAIVNVSLLIDDVIVETNTSGFNGTYEFVYDTPNNDHTWSILAFNNFTKFNTSETRDIFIEYIFGWITLNSPADEYESDVVTIDFNCSAESRDTTFLQNVSLWTNETGDWAQRNYTQAYSFGGQSDSTTDSNYKTVRTISSLDNNTVQSVRVWLNSTTGTTAHAKAKFNYSDGTSAETAEQVSSTPYWVSKVYTNPNPEKRVHKVDILLKQTGTGTAYSKNYTLQRYNYEAAWTRITPGDNFIWTCKKFDVDGTERWGLNRTVNFNADAPTIAVETPNGTLDSIVIGELQDFNVTFTDSTLDSCWYEYNYTNTTIPCVSGVKYDTNLTLETGQYNLTAYANDTLGNLAVQFVEWSYVFLEYNQTYTPSTTETTLENYTMAISYNSSTWSAIEANLYYGADNLTGVVVGDGDDVTVYTQQYVPGVDETGNVTFYWTIDLTNVTGTFSFNSTINQQEVAKINFTVCDYSDSPQIYFETYSTTSPTTAVNATFASAWTITKADGGDVVLSRSYEDTTEVNSSWGFCITPNSSTYTVSVDLTVDATNYTPTNHYIVDTDYSGATENISLYLLHDDLSTLTELRVTDVDNIALQNVYINIQRYDVGTDTYYTVAQARTDSSGSDLAYLRWYEDWYKFIGTYQETVGFTDGPKKISSTPQNFRIGEITDLDYQKFKDISYSLIYNNVTQNFVLTYVDPSGLTSSNCMKTIKRNVTADYLICNTCSTSSSATLYCNIASAGNGTFLSSYYASGSPNYHIDFIEESINPSNELYQLIGNDNGTGLAILIAGIVLALFLISPAISVFGAILGLIAGVALGFQPLDYMSFLGIVAVGVAIMWAVQK